MKPLLSPSQLASVQKVALSGMQVIVVVKRPDFGSDDLGDGAHDKTPTIIVQPSGVLRNGNLYGYLREIGGDTVGGVDNGSIVTTATYELGVPTGTDVLARDLVEIGGKEYRVQSVKDDDSWPAMWNCILRRRE